MEKMCDNFNDDEVLKVANDIVSRTVSDITNDARTDVVLEMLVRGGITSEEEFKEKVSKKISTKLKSFKKQFLRKNKSYKSTGEQFETRVKSAVVDIIEEISIMVESI